MNNSEEIMIAALQDGAALCRLVLAENEITASAKKDDSPVTIADYGVQALVCRAISRHFPEDAVIAEEGAEAFMTLVSETSRREVIRLLERVTGEGVTEADVTHWLDYGQGRDTVNRTWVIDPIDGTVGFVGGRYYSMCIALLENYIPTYGFIGMPRSPLHESGSIVYTDGNKVMHMPLNNGTPQALGASKRTSADMVKVMESQKLSQPEFDLGTRIRRAGGIENEVVEYYDSQLKYAMIAAGYGDLFIRLPRDIEKEPHYIWDHAPGAALIRASGGLITDLKGNLLDFSKGKALPHTGFIASNGHLHEAALIGANKVLRGIESYK